MTRSFYTIVRRELLVRLRSPGDIAHPMLFLLAVTALFPLAIGASPDTLARIAPGVIWVATLLALLLSLDLLFRDDLEDGSLEQLALTPTPLAWLVLAKVVAHWLACALPAILLSPVLALWLNFSVDAIPALMATLLLGTPALSVIGAIGSALTVGLHRGGSLLALLVLPLYVPVLVFGAGAVDAAASGLSIAGPLRLLGALSLLAVTLGPLAIAAGIRVSLD
jgi:heme exporter protein B